MAITSAAEKRPDLDFMRWLHIYTRVMRVPHFYYRRVVLGLVNLLVGPPGWAPQEMLRAGLLRLIGCRVGSHCQISEHFYIYQGYNLSLGDGGRIGSFARIWDFCPIPHRAQPAGLPQSNHD